MIDEMLAHEPDQLPADSLLFKIWQHEYIKMGLQDI
jgi:hypothetical protein